MKINVSKFIASLAAGVALLGASSAGAAVTSITAPGTVTISEDGSTTIAYSISDADDPSGATVTTTATAVGHPANLGLTLVDVGGNTRSVLVTPAAGLSGNGNITITAGDGNGADSTRLVYFKVLSVNDEPTFTLAGDVTGTAAVAYPSGANYATAVNANDPGQTVSFTLVNNNTALFSVQPQLTGSGAARTLIFTPRAGAGGSATVTVTGQDNGGTASGGDNSNSGSFVITVNGVNRAPKITAPATVTTSEDTQVGPVNFSISDLDDSTGTSLTVTVTASTLSSVVPTGNVTVGGAGNARTVTITPVANMFGNATLTLQVNDGQATATDTFLVRVLSVNDTPSFTVGADQEEDATVGAVTVAGFATGISAGPSNEAAQTVTFLVSNDNASLFTAAGQPKVSSAGTLTFTPNATTPTGTAVVTVIAKDNGSPAAVSAPQYFDIVINHVNVAPTIGTLAAQTLNEDGSVTLNITVGDLEDPTGDSLVVTPTSSGNTTVLPTCNVEVSCSGTLRTVTVTPQPDEFSNSFFAVELTVKDADCATATMTFSVRVLSVNDAPSFSLEGVLYGADVNYNELVVINPEDGCITDTIGCFGREIIALAVSPTNGKLYGGSSALDGGYFVEIDIESGRACVIGAFFPVGCDVCGDAPANTLGDLAFTSDGTLYGFSHADDKLYTVNLETGEATLVDESAPDVGFVLYAGLAASGDDILFFAKRANGDLSIFDKETGVLSPVVDLQGYGDDIYDMDFDASGTLYAVIEYSGDTCIRGSDSQLVRIDTESGEICEIGPIGFSNQVRSIAFGNSPICVPADSGPVAIECFAKDIDPGDNDTAGHESLQVINFTVVNDDNTAFAAQPALSADGILTFTPNADLEDDVTVAVTVTLNDNGGTTNGGTPTSRSQTFLINIKAPEIVIPSEE